MRTRLGLLVVVLAAVAACAVQDEPGGSSTSEITTRGLEGLSIAKVGAIPRGLHASYAVVDDDHAIWGAFGDDCSETAFTRFAKGARELEVLPVGAWRSGKVSADGRWVVAVGAAGATCSDEPRELHIAPTDRTMGDVTLGAASDFDFAGELIVTFESGGRARALRPAGGEVWSVEVGGAAPPSHAIAADGRVLVFTSQKAKLVAKDGTVTDILGFPAFADRPAAKARGTFVSTGSAVVELPSSTSGSDVTVVTVVDGRARTMAELDRPVVWSTDHEHFAYVSRDQQLSVLDRGVSTGLETSFTEYGTPVFSANGERLVVAGKRGAKYVVAARATKAGSEALLVLGDTTALPSALQVSDDGTRVVFQIGTGKDAALFVADPAKAASVTPLAVDLGPAGLASFAIETGPLPRALVAWSLAGSGALVRLDGSGTTELPQYSGNVGWANGHDFYAFDGGATLGVVSTAGARSTTLVPHEDPATGTRFLGGAISPSGKIVFVAAGRGTYRIDTATVAVTPAPAKPGADDASRTGDPNDGTVGGITVGTSGGGGSASAGTESTTGELRPLQLTTAGAGGCAAGGSGTGASTPLALGLAALALVRRRRRAVR